MNTDMHTNVNGIVDLASVCQKRWITSCKSDLPKSLYK